MRDTVSPAFVCIKKKKVGGYQTAARLLNELPDLFNIPDGKIKGRTVPNRFL